MALTDPNDSQSLPGYTQAEVIEILERIQKCVLWLPTLSVHHADHVRPNPDGSKVGGHQAGSASLVSIMPALYFYWLQTGDRVSVKPHASPALHAIHALLGNLPFERLRDLRSYKGLKAHRLVFFCTATSNETRLANNVALRCKGGTAYVRHSAGVPGSREAILRGMSGE